MQFEDLCKTNLLLAQDEALNLRHQYVEPEHIIWVELRVNNAHLTEFMNQKNISKAQLQGLLKERMGDLPLSASIENRKGSARFKQCLDKAKNDNQLVRWRTLVAMCIGIPNDPLFAVLHECGISPSEFKNYSEEEEQIATTIVSESTSDDVLERYAVDLVQQAKEGKISDVIGREREIRQITTILLQMMTNNPLLIGDPGVGKTQIVEGLAVKISKGEVSEKLQGKRILSLDLGSLLAGANYRGEFEERLKSVIKAVVGSKGKIILFVDEIHTIMGAGQTSGALDAANILKPALARGELWLIGATTYGEYRKYFEKDPAFSSRFMPVMIAEPSQPEMLEILKGVRPKFVKHHDVEIPDPQLETIVSLAHRYIGESFFPRKGIQLLDNTCARVKLSQILGESQNTVIQNEDIAKSVAEKTGIPVDKIFKDESTRLLNLEDELNNAVVGQKEAIACIAKRIRMMSLPFRETNRPRGVFLFMGPSGTGKTMLAKQLAERLFDNANHLVRLDMSEYVDQYSTRRLTGADPGLVGYEEGGVLTEAIRRRPYSLVLLDEIDKAHRTVCTQFLQVFDDGRLMDGKGNTINFSNTIFILTSNHGFSNQQENILDDEEKMAESGIRQLKQHIGPEFIKRIDEIVVFKYLQPDMITKIIDQKFSLYSNQFANTVNSNRVQFEVDQSVKEYIVREGFQKEFGARSITTFIDSEIASLLADEILRQRLLHGTSYSPSIVKLHYRNEQLQIELE